VRPTNIRPTFALVATVLSVVAPAQSNSAAVKYAYSMGEASASRISIRSTFANDPHNQTMLADLAAVDQTIQRHAQKLGVDPAQVLVVLKGVAPNSPDANLLNSHAESALEGILNADGAGDKLVKAFSLGWKVSAYSHTCAVALDVEHQRPDIAASVITSYPAMADQLKTGAADFGLRINPPQVGQSIAETCNRLNSVLTSLNNSLQVH
jgi:hypothetical protein